MGGLSSLTKKFKQAASGAVDLAKNYGPSVLIGVGASALGPVAGAVGTTIAGVKAAKQAAGDLDLVKTQSDFEQQAVVQEGIDKAAAVNDALSDNTIDSGTQQELLQLYQSGAASTQIASTLAAARAGTGVYGIRRLNNAQAKNIGSSPGRKQLSSLGSLF